jgi:hypothetical protein
MGSEAGDLVGNPNDRRLEITRLIRLEKSLKRTIRQQSPRVKTSLDDSSTFLRSLWERLQTVGGIVITILTIGTIFLAYYELRPKIDVTKDSDSLNSANPMSSQFVVKNNSLFTLGHASAWCWIKEVKLSDNGGSLGDDLFADQDLVPPIDIPPGQTQTVPCIFDSMLKLPKKQKIASADIEIRVIYRYLFWWRPLTFRSRFVTQRASNGDLKWFAQPHL